MNITVHRGSNQIGGSCFEIATANTRIILDAGQILPSLNERQGANILELPKISGFYKNDYCTVNAVFFSHYHGDHVGLIEYIHPDIPVYMGEATAKVMNMTSRFVSSRAQVKPAAYFVSGQPMRIGNITVTPYLVDHSAYDAYAFVIQADDKCVVYSGDLRTHGKKAKATWYFLKHLPQRVDVLLLEGTMMSRRGESVWTESELEQQAFAFMTDIKKPVFILQSTVNIDRLVGMYRAATRSNRLFVMDIFTANIVAELGEKIPNPYTFKNVRVFYPKCLTKRMFKERESAALMARFGRYKILREELSARHDYCMLIRDSMLRDLKGLSHSSGAGFIYSLWGGYLQTAGVGRLMQYVKEQQMKVIHVHTSGHADSKTLQQIVEACSPRKVIPIHTECPEAFRKEFNHVELVHDGESVLLN